MRSFQGFLLVVTYIGISFLLYKLNDYHSQLKAYRRSEEATLIESKKMADNYESELWKIEESNKKLEQESVIYTKAIKHLRKRSIKDIQRYNLLVKEQKISNVLPSY